MSVLKSIITAPKLMIRRRKQADIIRKYDRQSDSSFSSEKSSLELGYNKFKIDDLLESPGLTERMRKSKLRSLPSNGDKVYFSWEVPSFVWDAVLNSDTLFKVVYDYIGRGVRLDDIYVKNVVDGYDATAEGWHNDNVGYRLKLFMVFDTDGTPSATLVRPTPRPNLYDVEYKQEFLRSFKNTDMTSYPDEVIVDYTPGDCLFFDTNLQHRGSYHAGTGVRYCVIAEFMDKNKSDALRGRAPCGPGQGRKNIEMPACLVEEINSSPLMDKRLLKQTDGKLSYGYWDC